MDIQLPILNTFRHFSGSSVSEFETLLDSLASSLKDQFLEKDKLFCLVREAVFKAVDFYSLDQVQFFKSSLSKLLQMFPIHHQFLLLTDRDCFAHKFKNIFLESLSLFLRHSQFHSLFSFLFSSFPEDLFSHYKNDFILQNLIQKIFSIPDLVIPYFSESLDHNILDIFERNAYYVFLFNIFLNELSQSILLEKFGYDKISFMFNEFADKINRLGYLNKVLPQLLTFILNFTNSPKFGDGAHPINITSLESNTLHKVLRFSFENISSVQSISYIFNTLEDKMCSDDSIRQFMQNDLLFMQESSDFFILMLCNFWNSFSTVRDLLKKNLMSVLKKWGSRILILNSPTSYHLYLSKLLFVLSLCFEKNEVECIRNEFVVALLSAIEAHLESLDSYHRYISMYIGKRLMASLYEHEVQLNFDVNAKSEQEKILNEQFCSLETQFSNIKKVSLNKVDFFAEVSSEQKKLMNLSNGVKLCGSNNSLHEETGQLSTDKMSSDNTSESNASMLSNSRSNFIKVPKNNPLIKYPFLKRCLDAIKESQNSDEVVEVCQALKILLQHNPPDLSLLSLKLTDALFFIDANKELDKSNKVVSKEAYDKTSSALTFDLKSVEEEINALSLRMQCLVSLISKTPKAKVVYHLAEKFASPTNQINLKDKIDILFMLSISAKYVYATQSSFLQSSSNDEVSELEVLFHPKTTIAQKRNEFSSLCSSYFYPFLFPGSSKFSPHFLSALLRYLNTILILSPNSPSFLSMVDSLLEFVEPHKLHAHSVVRFQVLSTVFTALKSGRNYFSSHQNHVKWLNQCCLEDSNEECRSLAHTALSLIKSTSFIDVVKNNTLAPADISVVMHKLKITTPIQK